MKARRESGQIAPLLLLVVVAIVALGTALFEVGRASTIKDQAQTAADAAALAAVDDLRAQILSGLTLTRLQPLAGLSDDSADASAAQYANANQASLDPGGYSRDGLTVTVSVTSDDAITQVGGHTYTPPQAGHATAVATLLLRAGVCLLPGPPPVLSIDLLGVCVDPSAPTLPSLAPSAAPSPSGTDGPHPSPTPSPTPPPPLPAFVLVADLVG